VQANLWSHAEIAFYVLIALVFAYKPPATGKGLGAFIERHYGDSVGFYVLHLGIVLVVISALYPKVSIVASTGNGLIMASMAVLKLTKVANGSSSTSTVATSTTTTVTPPTAPDIPPPSVTVKVEPPAPPETPKP
jgi:hypothetical protein